MKIDQIREKNILCKKNKFSIQKSRKKCKEEFVPRKLFFPSEIRHLDRVYVPLRNGEKLQGGNGHVRVYVDRNESEKKVVCKMFASKSDLDSGSEDDLYEEENKVYEALLKEPFAEDVTVTVLQVREKRVVMEYVDTPVQCYYKKNTWKKNYSVFSVFKDMVDALNTLSKMDKVAFFDATLNNFGYSLEDKRGRVIDLGGFQLLKNDVFHYSRPSYVPPQMWVKNLQSKHNAFCTIDVKNFLVEDLKAVGYYNCFCDALGYFFQQKGFFEARALMHTTGIYDCMHRTGIKKWDEKKRVEELQKIKHRYVTFLKAKISFAPEIVQYMLQCVDAKNLIELVSVVREAASWVENNLETK